MSLTEVRAAPALLQQSGLAVLLVNDDPGALFAMRTVLGDLDVSIVTAKSGEQALQRLLRQDFCVILMNVKMAGLDGFESTRRIRADPRFARLPIIALTANAMLEDRSKCLAAGASGYASKPVNTEQLLEQLRVWLAEPAAAR